MQRDRLARKLLDRRNAIREIAARMRRLAGDLHLHEHAALAPVHHIAAWPPRLRVEHGAGAPRLGLDNWPARGRADLLIRGEQPEQRRRRAAELLEGGE